MNIRLYFLIIFTTISCVSKDKFNTKHKDLSRKEKFISIDSINFEKHQNLSDLRAWLNDTITETNWKIEYLVKNDSTIDKDIYIKVSKNKFKNTFKGTKLLEYRRYFIPTLFYETQNEIIFKHGCATECSALTLISKQNTEKMEEYINVVDFNKDQNILIYLTDSTFTNEDKMFQLEIINLNTRKKSRLTLKNICTPVLKTSCIDTIIYKPSGRIEIITSLRENFNEVKNIKKTNLIKI